jgi:ABC-type protease/lipase transport system fused ATPase/permease subunit
MIQLLRSQRQMPASSELAAALGACRRAFLAIGLFSGMSNILMLTGSLFMLEVYDRVLPSRSIPTLVALLILTAGLYAAQGFIDAIRSRILVRIGDSLDETMSMRVYDAIVRLPLKIGSKGDGSQPIRDLDAVRGFLSGAGPSAFFDLPWLPVYLGICFLFHPYIGLTALGGAIILVTLTIATEARTRSPTRHATQFAIARNALLESSRRNAEAMTAMGMVGRIAKRWRAQSQLHSGDRPSQRCRRRAWRRLENAALSAAILAARGRRLAGDPSGIDTGHHHRRFHFRSPRTGAGRSCDRQLAGLRRRAAELATAVAFACTAAAAQRADAAADAVEVFGGAKRRSLCQASRKSFVRM